MAKSSAVHAEAPLKPKAARSGRLSIEHSLNHALPDLDRIIHERMRLGIVSALAVNDCLTFNELKKLLQTTDGNLSVHARRWKKRSTSPARNRSKGGCRKPSTS